MTILWCWRCEMEVPMPDDEEIEQTISLRGTGTGADLRERQFGLVLREYERITGFHETNIDALCHHVVLLYGPPCSYCGKPLRTPQAKFCAACMAARRR
jgi:hypothetical protein